MKTLIDFSCLFIIFQIFLIRHVRSEGLVHGKSVVQFFYQLFHFDLAYSQFFLGKYHQGAVIIQYKNVRLQGSLHSVQNHVSQKI